MDHAVVINTNSFPAQNRDQAAEYFEDALQGVLELNTGSDRYSFYLDYKNIELADFLLAENYTYSAFLDELDDVDLLAFLQEVEDKSPALDSLTDEQFEEAAEYQFYLKDHGTDINPDVFSLAWVLSASLLSIPTDTKWDTHLLNIARTEDGTYIDEAPLQLKNIARFAHGEMLYSIFHQQNLQVVCGNHYICQGLRSWFEEQTEDNRRRILEKLELAVARNFQGGRPLFETLTNANGIRELRLRAYPGGATRILFKGLADGRQALLVGFIKKNDTEGYPQAIATADAFYKAIN